MQSQLASASSKLQRSKFKFPREDPPQSDIVDLRSDSEKLTDILRTWSQCLSGPELSIWNQICERDLSRDISLKSGLRTCQSIIKSEIKDFKNTSTDQKSEMCKLLENVPSLESPNEFNSLLSHGNLPSDNPSCKQLNAQTVLLPSNPPTVTHLPPEILSHTNDHVP